MQRAKTVVLTPANPSVNNIAQSQSPTAAAGFTLNGSAVTGGVAVLDMPRRVLFTNASNETGHTVTITGTADGQRVITDTLALLTAGSGYTNKDFKTITSIAISGNATGNIQVGTNQGLSSPWIPISQYDVENIGLDGILASGSVMTWGVQHTMDDPFYNTGPNQSVDNFLTPFDHPVLQSQTVNNHGSYQETPVRAVRFIITSYTNGGTFTGRVVPGSS